MSELKPCPFCGEEPNVFSFNDGRFIVECSNSDCDVYPYTSIHHDKADAIAAWNQRATVYTKPTTLSQLQAENTRLWARVDAQNRDLEMHEYERSKLRELVRDMWHDMQNQLMPPWSGEYKQRMRELGVEVDA